MRKPIGLAFLVPILAGCAAMHGKPDADAVLPPSQAAGSVAPAPARDVLAGKGEAPIVLIQNSRDTPAASADSLKINGDLQTLKLEDALALAQRKLGQGQTALIALDLGRVRQTLFLAHPGNAADDHASRKNGGAPNYKDKHAYRRTDIGRGLKATAISRQTGEVVAYVINARTGIARVVRIPVHRQESTAFTPELPIYGKLQTIQAAPLPPLVLSASAILEQARNAPVIPLSRLSGDIAAGRAKSVQQAAADEQKAKETSQKTLAQLAEASKRGRQGMSLAMKDKPAETRTAAAPNGAGSASSASGSNGAGSASGGANGSGGTDAAAKAALADLSLPAAAPGAPTETCPIDTSALSERIPAMHISKLDQARNEAIRADVLGMMRQANRQGIAPEEAIRSAIQQSREFDKTTNNALRAASASHVLGKSDDDFMAMVSDETLQVNECKGPRNGALCAAIMTRIASMKARNIAVAMSCHVAKGTWPK